MPALSSGAVALGARFTAAGSAAEAVGAVRDFRVPSLSVSGCESVGERDGARETLGTKVRPAPTAPPIEEPPPGIARAAVGDILSDLECPRPAGMAHQSATTRLKTLIRTRHKCEVTLTRFYGNRPKSR